MNQQVSQFKLNNDYLLSQVSHLNDQLRGKIEKFEAGRLAVNYNRWLSLTTDSEILSTISGLPIEKEGLDLGQTPPVFPSSEATNLIIDEEIEKLLKKKVIVECGKGGKEFFSPIFLTDKKDGGHRMILNLKTLNKNSEKVHFKMDTIYSIMSLIKKGCYFTKIDLKDAYYSVKVCNEDSDFLKFTHRGKHYKFIVLPNGYLHGPRKFTKIMKVPLCVLRLEGIDIIIYLDDLLIMSSSIEEGIRHTMRTIQLLESLGFTVHPEPKSCFWPTTEIEFLGAIFDSLKMIITLPDLKKVNIRNLCLSTLAKNHISVRQLASLIGKFSSSFPASKWGRLYYRGLESQKIRALKNNAFNFEAKVCLDGQSKKEISWWAHNVASMYNDLYVPAPSVTILTDASSLGWGAVMEGNSTGGFFSSFEQAEFHINIKELMAILFGLKSLANSLHDTHIKILSDNTTAVASVNKFGSIKSKECDRVATAIWNWAMSRNIHLSASHIPGVDNLEADAESRKMEVHTEWQLKPSIFDHVCRVLDFLPSMDLFASRINHQLPLYMSYRPDPGCVAVDAFLEHWHNIAFYAFPPFAIIPLTLQKIYFEKAKGIIVVPDWPSQPWYIRLKEMTVASTILSPRMDLLQLPNQPSLRHPLARKMRLLCCLVDGNI